MRLSRTHTDELSIRRRDQRSGERKILNDSTLDTDPHRGDFAPRLVSSPHGMRDKKARRERVMLEATSSELDHFAQPVKKRRPPSLGDPAHPRRSWRMPLRFIKIILGIAALALLGGIGFFGYKFYVASGGIFRGGGQSALGLAGIDTTKLQHEGDGRINVLLVGDSEDDPNHPGADLTDSIMVASLDLLNKSAALVSIPRDLWVRLPNCSMFTAQKLNAAYECGEHDHFKQSGLPAGGIGLLQKTVQQVTGLAINYYAKVDYTAFRDAVNAVGGIDITIDSSDPRGIYDPNFDWNCRYKCFEVKYPNGPVHLNGAQALFLARSRNDAGGYGLPRGDFDRTEYQRKILIALKAKLTSAQTLGNPVTINNLIDSVGNNVSTSFSRADMLQLYSLLRAMPVGSVQSLDLAAAEVVTAGQIGDVSAVVPTAGLYEYGDLQAYLRTSLPDPYITKEAPTIAVYNATATPGVAAAQADLLRSYGYTLATTGNAPASATTKLYDTTHGAKPITARYLANRYKASPSTGTLPKGADGTYIAGDGKSRTADFVVIIGVAPQ
jgi:LCP family protein required for cell wall assembly